MTSYQLMSSLVDPCCQFSMLVFYVETLVLSPARSLLIIIWSINNPKAYYSLLLFEMDLFKRITEFLVVLSLDYIIIHPHFCFLFH